MIRKCSDRAGKKKTHIYQLQKNFQLRKEHWRFFFLFKKNMTVELPAAMTQSLLYHHSSRFGRALGDMVRELDQCFPVWHQIIDTP